MQRAIVRAAEISGSLVLFLDLGSDLKIHTVVSPVTGSDKDLLLVIVGLDLSIIIGPGDLIDIRHDGGS